MKILYILLFASFFTFLSYCDDELPDSLKPGRHTKLFDRWDLVLKTPNDLISGMSKDIPIIDYLWSTALNVDENIYLTGVDVGTPTPISVGLILGVSRRVVSNRLLDDSWTVIDSFKIGASASVFYTSHGFTVGAEPWFFFEIIDIRQVTPNNFRLINPIKYNFAKFKKMVKKEEDTSPSLEKIKEDHEVFYNFMPKMKLKSTEHYARIGNFFNPLISVFRLPLKHTRIKKIAKNEIISFSINGGITFSACFGTVDNCNKNNPRNFQWSDLGIPLARVGVFLEGKYQISIMREEKGNFARVRVAKVKKTGVEFAVGSAPRSLADQVSEVSGFMLGPFYAGSTLGGILKIQPFSIQGSFTYAKFFNQSFRFNLDTEKGRKAYDKAVLGNFQLADEYSRDGKGNVVRRNPNHPVLRLLTREEKRKTYRQESGIDLFLLKFWKNKVVRTSVIKETRHQESDEEITRFEALVLNERQMEIFFGAVSEKRSHQFFTKIDEKKFMMDNRPKDTLTMIVNVKRYDKFMTSKEYVTYVSEFEDNVGYPGIFPLPPKNNKGEWDRLNLGKGAFTYNLKFDWRHIKKLVEYPKEKMWKALSIAFNAEDQGWETKKGRSKRIAQRLGTYLGTIPLSMAGQKFPKKDDILVANLKYGRWKKLKKYLKRPKRFNEKLAKFFNSGDYGPEMIKLLRVISPNAKIPYSGTAKSKLFNDGEELIFGDYARFLLPNTDENLMLRDEFINQPEKKGIRVSELKVDAIGKLFLKISFNLEYAPGKMFFSLAKKDVYIETKKFTKETLVVENHVGLLQRRRFKKGKNRFFIRIGNEKHWFAPILKKLDLTHKKRSRRYKLNVAASKDGMSYGSYETGVFGIYPAQSDEFLQGYLDVLKKEENICLGRAASELMLLLGDKKYLVCPDKAPKNSDGTCKEGFTPYGHFSNRPLKENLEKRDDWILKHCPKLGSEKYIKALTKSENICRGKTAVQIIDIIKNDPFFVCPKKAPRFRNGFCMEGFQPYPWYSNKPLKENIKARNAWLFQTCGGRLP